MTITEFLTEYASIALFAEEINTILDNMKKDERSKALKSGWDSDISEYPDSFKNVLRVIFNYHTIEYMDKNCPEHWAREFFSSAPLK